MAGADIYVSFGGDTAGLEASLALAKAETNAVAREMRALAAEMAAAGSSADAQLVEKMRKVGAELSSARAQAREFAAALSEMSGSSSTAAGGVDHATQAIARSGSAAHGAGAGIGFYAREAHAMMDEFLSGRTNQLEGTISNVASTFLIANTAMIPYVAGLAAVAATLGRFAFVSYETKAAATDLKSALSFSGVGNVAEAEIDKIIAGFKNLNGIFSGESWDDIRKVAVEFGRMSDASTASIAAMVAVIPGYMKATSTSLADASKEMKALLEGPPDGGAALEKTLHNLTEAEREHLKAVEATGSVTALQTARLEIMAERSKTAIDGSNARTREEIQLALDDARANLQRAEATDRHTRNSTAQIASLRETISVLQEQEKALNSGTDAINKQVDAMRLLGDTRVQMDRKLSEAIALGDPSTASIEKLNSTIGTLQTRLQGAGHDAAELIKSLEAADGKTPSLKPYMDKSPGHPEQDHWAVGFGQHSLNGVEVTKDTTATQEEIYQDFSARVAKIQADLAREVGASWANLSTGAKAALTSMAYNYGDIATKLPSLIKVAQSGDEPAIAEAIRARKGDNGGVNANRREMEAENIGGLAGGDQREAATRALANQKDELQALKEKQDGINAASAAQLEILKATAEGRHNEIADAERTVAARKQALELANSAEAKTKAQTDLLSAQNALEEKIYAAKKAQAALVVAGADSDPKSQRDAKLAEAQIDIDRFSPKNGEADTAQFIAAKQKIASINLAYDQEMAKDDAAAEDARAKKLLDGVAASVEAAKQKAGAGQLGIRQLVQAELEAEAQRTQIERDHLTRLMTIWGEGTAEYRKAKKALETLEADSAVAREKINADASKKMNADWQSFENSLSSSFSGQVKGLLSGTETFAGAFKNIASGMATHFIEQTVKMAVEWAAQHLGMQSIFAAFQASIAGASATGAAAAAAASKPGTIAAITADSAQAFAGFSANLAPALGPAAPAAAAGLAASVQSTAIGMAAFDIGAWSLPADQLAMVHKNELIMPAAEASAFRGMLTGAANGGQQGGGAVVHNHNWNIATNDASSFMSQLGSVTTPLAKMISKALDANPSIRPKYT